LSSVWLSGQLEGCVSCRCCGRCQVSVPVRLTSCKTIVLAVIPRSDCGRGWQDWEKKNPDAHRGTFTRASGRPKPLHWPGNRTVFPGCGIDLGEGNTADAVDRISGSLSSLVISLSSACH
jgi:hypothetical protein